MPQLDLEGEEITFEKVISEKTNYYRTHFCMSVTETGEAELDKLREGDVDISTWIAKHMRVKNPMPIGNEGKCFQNDIVKFKLQLEKGTTEKDVDELTKEME